jgi:hypothetical protein
MAANWNLSQLALLTWVMLPMWMYVYKDNEISRYYSFFLSANLESKCATLMGKVAEI